jgi:hypothetical protein
VYLISCENIENVASSEFRGRIYTGAWIDSVVVIGHNKWYAHKKKHFWPH